MEPKKTLNIFFTVDKNYIIHFGVTLTSILENNKDLDINVFIIHDLEDTRILGEIISFAKNAYKVTIHLTTLDNSIFDNFLITSYISKAAYFRLLIADIIPANVQSGLYIDCDTIVTASLRELAEISYIKDQTNEEYSLLAVNDKNQAENIERLEKIGVKTDRYFNSGVLMINLKKWRQDKVSAELIRIGKDYKDRLIWHDQDVLNIFFSGKSGSLNPAYNAYVEKKPAQMPLVIHFSGLSKPWHYFDSHPYKAQYWKYLRLTPFKNKKFEKITAEKVFKKYKWRLKKYAKSIIAG